MKKVLLPLIFFQKRKYSTASFSDSEITPRKLTNPVSQQKVVAMETKPDLDLSMSIDSSFEEEICRADLDQVIADQGNHAPPVKDQKTESGPDLEDNPLHVTVTKNVMEISDESPNVLTLEKDEVLVENTDLNLDKSAEDTNLDHGHTDTLTNDDLSHKDSFTNSHLSSTSALTGDGHGGCEPLQDHDQCKSKVSVDTDQNCHQDTKESENQSSSADNKVTASLHSIPSVNKESASAHTNMSQIPSNGSALVRSLENEINIKVLDIKSLTPDAQRSGARIDKKPVKSDTSKFPTASNQSHLVRSPEEELIARLTPQTPSSQHGLSGLTPQTPSSQEGRGVYQAKMARLLSYGSPSSLTLVRTPVSRTVTKGFKPPSFVKK